LRFHAQGPDAAAAQTLKKRRPRGGPAAGYEGEDIDIVHGGAAEGPLKLQLPQRFAEGTWMAAAWRVLAGVGPEGMYINDVSAAMWWCGAVRILPVCAGLRAAKCGALGNPEWLLLGRWWQDWSLKACTSTM
jgi:hypothetical protein